MAEALARCAACKRLHKPHCGNARPLAGALTFFAENMHKAFEEDASRTNQNPVKKQAPALRDAQCVTHADVAVTHKPLTDAQRQAGRRARLGEAYKTANAARMRAKRAK